MKNYDTIIIGGGAAGLMCAIEAGKRGRTTCIIDHAKKIGEKIRISGGGRCNFTNIHASPSDFLSQNPHFCKSALSQYTPQDFIRLVEKHKIAHHEKEKGQLFCDISSTQIVEMLLKECKKAKVEIKSDTMVDKIESGYKVQTTRGEMSCQSLVIATGGLSIPKIGASKFGHDIAKQFGLRVVKTTPALVPLTFSGELLEGFKSLAGVSVNAIVSCESASFNGGLLFTHRGLSGPAILQISSYLRQGGEITIRIASPPKRLAKYAKENEIDLENWTVKPSGSEGYRKAEVTRGGVDVRELSSQTMEARKQKGLYFIGEVLDVTGHLGGFNFQWAWSSGYAAGQNV